METWRRRIAISHGEEGRNEGERKPCFAFIGFQVNKSNLPLVEFSLAIAYDSPLLGGTLDGCPLARHVGPTLR